MAADLADENVPWDNDPETLALVQKKRKVEAELRKQASQRKRQIDFMDLEMDKGRVKKIRKKQEFVPLEGKANPFVKVEAKKYAKH
jgi:hypothetical protein